MLSEFKIIQRYFSRSVPHVTLGIGDDSALINIPQGMELAISTDMLVEGTHFFHDTDAYQLGYKSLAVNLSDMAAMGAIPRWITLSIALPSINENWLDAFTKGFFTLADAHEVSLIGGDTSRGPLTICVQIMGEIAVGKALLRSTACVGDDIWVSGELGLAAMGLNILKKKITLEPELKTRCLERLNTPNPRVNLGQGLHGIASSCIDISDGLLQDIEHILRASSVGAIIYLPLVPHPFINFPNQEIVRASILAGGDDYELCFTASPDIQEEIALLAKREGLLLSRIGSITQEPDLQLLDADGKTLSLSSKGFDHFYELS